MKAEDVKIGLQVRHEYNEEIGIIKSLPVNDRVIVKWTNGWTDDDSHVGSLNVVDPVADQEKAKVIQDKIDKAKSELEKAFELLAEVKTEYRSSGYIFDEHLVSMKELQNTLEEGGWNSSSLWC